MPTTVLKPQAMFKALQWEDANAVPDPNADRVIRITYYPGYGQGRPTLTIYATRPATLSVAFGTALTVANEIGEDYGIGDSDPHKAIHSMRNENSITAGPHVHFVLHEAVADAQAPGVLTQAIRRLGHANGGLGRMPDAEVAACIAFFDHTHQWLDAF